MNIIEYKINKNKLQELIEQAYAEGLNDISCIVNIETFQLMQARLWEHYLCFTDEATNTISCRYMGCKFIVNNELDFGEVKIFGFKHKECTRITCCSDGTPPKIENNAIEKIFVCIE
jgi:hypothetical protein